VSSKPTVGEALRRFLPPFTQTAPVLGPHQRRAIWAITHCRTPALGGRGFGCKPCNQIHFAYHSCNHKACPQCGRTATASWVRRELAKRVNAPYFLVTFTLPSQLRSCFFGPHAKEAYDMFFTAVSGALAEKLATDKGLRARVNGFTAVLHTWNQQLGFHPHIHCLVPGAGLNDRGRPVRVREAHRLVHREHLQGAFRQHMNRLMKARGWQADPIVWTMNWGVDIQPVGSGAPAIKYLGNYVARTAIGDGRMVHINSHSVTFEWKDRSNQSRKQTSTVSGIEFVTRYLRHVLPRGLRSVRYYGFCHPSAKANRMRVQFGTAMPVQFGSTATPPPPRKGCPCCPRCGGPTQLILRLRPLTKGRAPPVPQSQTTPCPSLKVASIQA
jgi:Putative transposase/Transposase zinc-binding domain